MIKIKGRLLVEFEWEVEEEAYLDMTDEQIITSVAEDEDYLTLLDCASSKTISDVLVTRTERTGE